LFILQYREIVAEFHVDTDSEIAFATKFLQKITLRATEALQVSAPRDGKRPAGGDDAVWRSFTGRRAPVSVVW
jgi:hypothetical protein